MKAGCHGCSRDTRSSVSHDAVVGAMRNRRRAVNNQAASRFRPFACHFLYFGVNGSILLSRTGSIIGDDALSFRIRNGAGRFRVSMSTEKKAKKNPARTMRTG